MVSSGILIWVENFPERMLGFAGKIIETRTMLSSAFTGKCDRELIVLLFHHEADSLTRHHLALLEKFNSNDPRTKIVPITFPEYASRALPGSYIATHATTFRINPDAIYHRFRHSAGPLIPDLDCLLWDYVLYGEDCADHIILAEGDMLSRCSIRDFFGPSLIHSVGGSTVRLGGTANRNWYWFDKANGQVRQMPENDLASITPVCGIHLRWDVAIKIAQLLLCSNGQFNNMHVELAIGTLARLVGEMPMEIEVPEGTRPTQFIDWRKEGLNLSSWGIFHPVKEILELEQL